MQKKMLPTLLAGAAAVLLALAPAHAQNKPADKVTLMLNWYLYSEHAPFFLGKERNFYADEGIDLEIQEGRGSAVTAQAVAAKSATFGYIDVTTMIKAAAKGAPLKSTGVLFQVSPMSVMGFTDKNIKTPKDIIGKTVATTPGDSMSQMWPLFLKVNDIKPDQVKIVSGDGQTKLNAVMSGQADLLLGYVMDQAIKLQDATGKPVTPIRFADSGVNQISSGIITNKNLLTENPDLVKRFMRASTKAAEAAEKSPEAAVDAMLKANPKAGVRDTLIVGMKQSVALYHTKETANQPPFRVSMKNVSDSLDLLVQYGGMDPATRGKPEDYVTLDFLPSVK
ncbi:ABC transporter substrate-binding protein [Variovorax sp. PAMC 28711]|uniref:ABC transporter substrate-binding protein n=1 Tax=Variovorax sp. PAMC 28711 TaxID=1795631 RepID=UPI00078BDCA1|nr:ABC transporter substrate-binding protein [Variovorax sp. PAMC 28711]AMM26847.1 nitrate ABC transporter substrate-binding protein [Variovorax sp. PAMC 28711]